MGVRGGGGCTAHPLPSSGLKAAGSGAGERKGSAPSSSRRQCSCPPARHQPASCSARSQLLGAVHPSWTAWSWCDCRQLDGGAGKAVERSLACCHQSGVRVGEGAVVIPAQCKKDPTCRLAGLLQSQQCRGLEGTSDLCPPQLFISQPQLPGGTYWTRLPPSGCICSSSLVELSWRQSKAEGHFGWEHFIAWKQL